MFSFYRMKSLCMLLLLLVLLSNKCHISKAKEDLTEGEEKIASTLAELDGKVKVFTVATERTDGFLRYMRSARVYDIEVTPLGLDEEWKGGNMEGPGGGFKINLLREAVRPLKDEKDTIILFTDSYDVVFTTGLAEIVQKFKESNSKLLFSAEKYCWPDQSLASLYPAVEPKASAYLNSGAFIGYAPQVWSLIEASLADTDDDQLYYTQTYLNENLRQKLNMKLDTTSTVFQNLNGAKDDVKLDVDLDTNKGVLKNINFLTTPSIIHGNGGSKVELNAFANYLANTFNHVCLICQENRLELAKESDLPIISLALIVSQPVPFFDMFLNNTANLNYPKNRMHLFIYSGPEFHDSLVKSHLKRYEKEYLSSKIVLSTDQFNERRARQLALQQAKQKDVDYIFFIDADVQIDDPEVLRELLTLNRQFVAPLVSKHNELWSNFWGALTEGGYYARSPDYVDIVKGDIIYKQSISFLFFHTKSENK